MAYTHLNKLGKDLILDVINRTNTSSITFMDVDFSLPQNIPSAGSGRNTTVLVTALPNSRYKGERRVYYWRLPIDQVISEQYRRFPVEGSPTNTLQLIQEVNNRYGLRLTAEDIVVEEIDTSQKPVDISIRIKSGSYAYIGEVTLNVVAPAIDLSDIITIDLLEGLVYPEDVAYSIGGIVLKNPVNGLMYSPAVTDVGMYHGNNNELELAAGFFIVGAPSTASMNAMGNVVINSDDGEEVWRLVLSLNLLDNSRGEDLTELYDVNMRLFHEGGGDVEFNLMKNTTNNTLMFVSDHGPVEEHVPGYSLGFAKYQGMIDPYSVRNGFINLDLNAGNSPRGRFTARIKATPKRNLLILPIEFEIGLSLTYEPVVIAPISVNVAYNAAEGEFPLILSLSDPDETFPGLGNETVVWQVTNTAGFSEVFSGTAGNTAFHGGALSYDDWYGASPNLTISATLNGVDYVTTFVLAPPMIVT